MVGGVAVVRALMCRYRDCITGVLVWCILGSKYQFGTVSNQRQERKHTKYKAKYVGPKRKQA